MNNAKIKNISHSVKERLKIIAKQQGRKHQDLILCYLMERFLYRMSESKYGERFILKGALMLQVLGEQCTRATRDIDFMSQSDLSLDKYSQIVTDIMNYPVPNDGVVFDSGTIKINKIQKDARESGVRINFIGRIGEARATLQLDIGPYYKVIPSPITFYFPQLLNFGRPNLLGYSPESIIADKFEAMVSRDQSNTRLKDFYDIWILSSVRYFELFSLREAIKETFSYYKTPLPTEIPICFEEVFYSDKNRMTQWKTFLKNSQLETSQSFAEINEEVQKFLMPVCFHINEKIESNLLWAPSKGWIKNPISSTL